MKTYLITTGEYSDYGLLYVVEAEELDEETLRKYQLEATRRRSLYHDEKMEWIANRLGVGIEQYEWGYRTIVGHEQYDEAMKDSGYGESPDFLLDVLKENDIRDVDFEEFNLDEL